MLRFSIDLRQAWRRLQRDRRFAAVAVFTLALGIGANTAVFSVVRAVILQPLPYADPERLALLWGPERSETTWLSLQEVVNYGLESRSLSGVAGYREIEANLTGSQEPERVLAASVTPNLFQVLGVRAAYGRTPEPGADAERDTDVIVLSDSLWRRRFGAAPDVVGQRIAVNGRNLLVLGIMPARFRLPGDYHAQRATEAWTIELVQPANLGAWGNRSFTGVARLAGGVSPSPIGAELSRIAEGWVRAGFVQARPDGSLGALARRAIPVQAFVTGPVERPLFILGAAVLFVLLIACANVANLQLARAEIRQREVSLRAILGASRGRIVWQLLTESFLLAGAGGIAGLGVAWAGLRLVITLGPQSLPRLDNVALDGTVLLAAAALSVFTGILFGLVPALHLSRPDVGRFLSEGGRSTTGGRGRLWVRRSLVVLQLASSLVLALGAMLLIRSLVEMQRIELGFEPQGVLTAQLQLPATEYPRPDDVVRGFRAIHERVVQIPGVVAAGAVRVLPLSRPIGDWSIRIDGRPYVPAENPNADYQAVMPGYFEAMGIRLVRGRLLGPSDREDALPVAVINQTMADRYWPGEDAIGRRFMMGTDPKPWLTIVGIVSGVRHNAVIEAPRAEMYVAHAQLPAHIRSAPRGMALAVKTTRDPAALAPAVRDAVRAVSPNLPVSEVRPMREVTAQALAQPRFLTTLLGFFAVAALMLAAVGIYGTVSLLVAERTREIGIRIALGAGRESVLRMVLDEGARMTIAGLVLGVASAAGLTRALSGLLYGVGVLDPVTLVAVPTLLCVVGLAACVLPARRAAATPPALVLK
jgi:putative ABC transport system permease protein